MTLQCINKGNNKAITTGKEYEIINETDTRYAILNDKGIQANYAKNLFQILVVEDTTPIINELEVMTSMNQEDGEDGFIITIKIEGQKDYVFEGSNMLDICDSGFSCAIKTVEGLDRLMKFVNNFKEDFKNYLNDNIVNFKIDEDFDFDTFYKEIVELLITDLIAEYQNECLYLLLSTNVSNNLDYNTDVIDTLNDNSEVDLFGLNPNTDNDVKLWILKCN
jgi:hypothetical protein